MNGFWEVLGIFTGYVNFRLPRANEQDSAESIPPKTVPTGGYGVGAFRWKVPINSEPYGYKTWECP